ncbi:hypothetical protein ACHAXT_005037 [Thalassiosira profunda]
MDWTRRASGDKPQARQLPHHSPTLSLSSDSMARTRCLMRKDACAHHRSSAPTFREYRRAVSGSYRNEEWIEPPCKQIHLDETEGASSSTLYPEIYKSSSRGLVERSDFVDTFPEVGSHMTTQVEEKIAISFSDTAELISPHTPREPLDSWYTPADQHRFLHEVSARAATTRRMMEYASRNEASYNSATGLTAPHVLRARKPRGSGGS